MPFTDVPILCFCNNKTTFIESIRSNRKVLKITTYRYSKFNEYMLKVIEAYPPPQKKENM
jgi:GTP-binding protein